MTTLAAPPIPEATPVGSPVDPRFALLRRVKLGAVRAIFSPKVYRRSHGRALAWLAFDAACYLGLIAGIYLVPGALAKLALGVVAGAVVSFLFVWAHDAAHGSLFGSSRWAEPLGTLAMLPSLNMYKLWSYGHNKVHHGFTSYTPIDWIWRPLTPAEYRAASPWGRLVYRVERSLPGCGLHYALRVWWAGMVTFKADRTLSRKHHFALSRLTTVAFVVAASALAWWLGGGFVAVLAAVVVPWIVFTYFIALTVYLHHTHPELPFFDERDEWCASIGQVACSTNVRTPILVEWATHRIFLHTAHHVDTRIPFYRLGRARTELLASEFGQALVEYRFRWSTVRSIFRTCQLYDFATHRWVRFRDVRVATISS